MTRRKHPRGIVTDFKIKVCGFIVAIAWTGVDERPSSFSKEFCFFLFFIQVVINSIHNTPVQTFPASHQVTLRQTSTERNYWGFHHEITTKLFRHETIFNFYINNFCTIIENKADFFIIKNKVTAFKNVKSNWE